jgi:hypothetical protein
MQQPIKDVTEPPKSIPSCSGKKQHFWLTAHSEACSLLSPCPNFPCLYPHTGFLLLFVWFSSLKSDYILDTSREFFFRLK